MFAGQRYLIDKPIAFIGFMGSGKSTVGELLSKHTGIKFVDTDKEIVKVTKKTISEIINYYGEDEFRKIEAKVFDNCIVEKKYIISTGGGIVESIVSRGLLKKCFCIWLKVNSDVAEKRVIHQVNRPLFKDYENVKKLLVKRENLYKQYANLEIDTNNKSITDVCEEARVALIKADILHY